MSEINEQTTSGKIRETGVEKRTQAEAEQEARKQVDKKGLAGPTEGFGPLWRKTYRITLRGVDKTPEEVIKTWKETFQNFWPKGNRFYKPLTGIRPGESALIVSEAPGGLKFTTGVKIIESGENSFTFMTPKGHVFAGKVTFSSFMKGKYPAIQAQVIMRSPDPIMELGMILGGHEAEDLFWKQTLQNFARSLGVSGNVEYGKVFLDPEIQWSQLKNLRFNAIINSIYYTLTEPFRKLTGRSF